MNSVRATLLSACVLLSTGGVAQAQTRPLPDIAYPGTTEPTTPLFPTSTVGDLLTRHMDLMVSVGEDAELNYQTSLRRLQQEPEAVRLLQDAYGRTAPNDYVLRWQVVHTLASLNQRTALLPLAEIALSALPAESSESPEFFTRAQESHIRVAAVDGLAALAKQGVLEAETYLRRLTTSPDLSLRQRAVRGYLAAGSDYDVRVRTLQSSMPTSDHWLIHLRTTEVRRIPHPDDAPEGMQPRTRTRDDEAPLAR